jgi:hypothetical protein
MGFIPFLQQTLISHLPPIISTYAGEVTASSLSEMETAIKTLCHALGREILGQWLAMVSGPNTEISSRYLGVSALWGAARYVRWRESMRITLLGRVHYRRPYYGCPTCQQGYAPLDEALGMVPGQMSAEVQHLAALLGIHMSFASSQDVLWRTSQIELSANSMRTATHRVGQRVSQQEAQQHSHSQALEAQRQHQREGG